MRKIKNLERIPIPSNGDARQLHELKMEPRMFRFFVVLLSILTASALATSGARADWPERPLRLIVPFAAGSSSDTIARIVAAKMGDRLGQQVAVENRVGGSTIIGTQEVARAAPDGYTLGLANTTSHVVSFVLNPHLSFDPLRDFTPIGMIGSSPFMLVSSPHVPTTTLQEFVALAKAKPGSLSYASAGTGTLAHLAGELFKRQANVDVVHVPYHGTEQSLLDLMEGRIDLSVSTIPPTLPQIKQGTVRALAVMGDRRNSMLPDIPTVTEAGTPGCEAALWTAIVLPAGVPAGIVDRLSRTLFAVVNDPDMQRSLAAQGVDPQPGPPEAVTAAINADISKWRGVVTSANIVQAQ
jgi:tripartite-type tricarboxylate transporter receptor subunit TctC